MRLVASVVVRNELSRYLDLALTHLLSFCDGVVVLDDSSDDGTYEHLHALECDDERIYVTRTESPSFYVHEGQTRQQLLNATFAVDPDWVLSIDADEFVSDPDRITHVCENRSSQDVYTLTMEEVWNVDPDALWIRHDHQWKPRRCPILWRVPKVKTGAWMIPNVKLACGREPLQVRRTRSFTSGSSILHFGWANESERQQRYERYVEHDKGKFHRNAHLESIMWPAERVLLKSRPWPAGLAAVREGISARANVGRSSAPSPRVSAAG